jgi:hypothetical protein
VIVRVLWLVLALGCGGAGSSSSKATTGPELAPGREVTIYQGAGAIVVDRRWIDLPAGVSHIRLRDLPTTLAPDSLALRPLEGDVSVGERRFDAGAAATAGHALADAVGHDVELQRAAGAPLRGHLVAADPRTLVLDTAGARITVPLADVVWLGIAGARRSAGPVLDARVTASRSGRRLFELVYGAGALGFSVSYDIDLDTAGADPRVRLRVRAHIDNHSGLDMAGARVHLVDGALDDTEHPPLRFWSGRLALERAPGPRQLDALATTALPARFEAYYRGAIIDTTTAPSELYFGIGSQSRVARHLLIPLRRGGPLGAVLPAGPARVSLTAAPGEPPARIATALTTRATAGGDARFPLGDEPDLAGARRQVSIDRAPDASRVTESYELVLTNRGTAPAHIRVVEPLARSPRVTLDASQPRAHHDTTARELVWLIDVPPASDTKLGYTATYRFSP